MFLRVGSIRERRGMVSLGSVQNSRGEVRPSTLGQLFSTYVIHVGGTYVYMTQTILKHLSQMTCLHVRCSLSFKYFQLASIKNSTVSGKCWLMTTEQAAVVCCDCTEIAVKL